MSIDALIDASLGPLDAARRELVLGVWRVPWVGRLFQRSETRVPILASISVIIVSAVASVVPGLLFVLGPAIFGVLHVASDVRYLVIRRDLPMRWIAALASACIALMALRAFEMFAPGRLPFAIVEVALGWGTALLGACMGAAVAGGQGAGRRAGAAVLVLGAALMGAVMYPLQARALLAYGHNLVALVIWLVLFRARKSYAWSPVILAVAVSTVMISGTTVPWLRLDGPWALTFVDEALSVARRMPERTALGLGVSFVFLQALHYAAWMSWIPQEDTKAAGSPTFRMSVRSARKDFGSVGLSLVVILALAVVAMSIVAVHRTRAVYLSLATFHGYLEIASLAFLLTRGRGRADAGDAK
jgi:hypothetical protein